MCCVPAVLAPRSPDVSLVMCAPWGSPSVCPRAVPEVAMGVLLEPGLWSAPRPSGSQCCPLCVRAGPLLPAAAGCSVHGLSRFLLCWVLAPPLNTWFGHLCKALRGTHAWGCICPRHVHARPVQPPRGCLCTCSLFSHDGLPFSPCLRTGLAARVPRLSPWPSSPPAAFGASFPASLLQLEDMRVRGWGHGAWPGAGLACPAEVLLTVLWQGPVLGAPQP